MERERGRGRREIQDNQKSLAREEKQRNARVVLVLGIKNHYTQYKKDRRRKGGVVLFLLFSQGICS